VKYRPPIGSKCTTCGSWVTRRCTICRGEPDEDVSIETVARGCAQVHRAVRGYRRTLNGSDTFRPPRGTA
jgi:hypothetical protein